MSGRKLTEYHEQSEPHQFRPEEFDADVQGRFHKQEVLRDKLIQEAKLIKLSVQNQSLEQIYTVLETNVDNPNRVQLVMNEFLKMDTAEPETNKNDLLNGNFTKEENDTKPKTLKRALEKAECLVEETSNSPPHSKIRKYSTDQETTMVLQTFTTSKDGTENEEVEGSKEGGTAIKPIEFQADISIDDSVTDNNEHMYEYEQPSTSTRLNTDMDNSATHFNNPANNTLRLAASLMTNTTDKSESEGTNNKILPSVQPKETVLTDEQIKYKSRINEMFPDADPLYLKRECAGLYSEEAANILILKMLKNTYPIRKQVSLNTDDPMSGPSTASDSGDDDEIVRQYETLREILPNADPCYLIETCIRIRDNKNQMRAFITDALEKSNYPTLEQYRKRQQVLSLQQKYIEDFKIEEFVKIVPNPLNYFLKEKKNNENISEYAMAYLKWRYKKIRQVDLRERLQKSKYSLTETCSQLDKFKGPFLNKEREEFDWKLNVPLEVCSVILREVAFIENKEKILTYLLEREDKRKAAFLEAKFNGELLECECCYDKEVMAEDMATCSEGHLFCKECIRKAAEVKIGDGQGELSCLSDCGAEFHLMTLQAVLNPLVFSKMLQRKQIEEVKAAGIEGLETCPYCDFSSIPPREDKVFRCMNPECMKETCRKCREPSHIPFGCGEVEANEVRMRTTIENRMTEALVRTCWKCGKRYVKEFGCNVITCTCGALMCYFCRKPMTYYEDIFKHKCPHSSSDLELHVIPVRKEAEKAKEELKVLNPTVKLKHDPTKNL